MAEKEELEKLKRETKRVLQYLKIARKAGHVAAHALIDSDNFIDEVVSPLEKSCEWSTEDEKEVERLAVKFRQETEAKTLKEKSEQLNKLLKIGVVGGGLALGLGAVGVVATRLLKKDKNTKK